MTDGLEGTARSRRVALLEASGARWDWSPCCRSRSWVAWSLQRDRHRWRRGPGVTEHAGHECRVADVWRTVVRNGGTVREAPGNDHRRGRSGRSPELADRRSVQRTAERAGSGRVQGRLRAPEAGRLVEGQPPRGLRTHQPREHRVAVLPQQRAPGERSIPCPCCRQRLPDAPGLQRHGDRLGLDGRGRPTIGCWQRFRSKNPDGSAIVGPALEEITYDDSPPTSAPLTYAAATLDKTQATLTVRLHYSDPPVAIAPSGWYLHRRRNGRSSCSRPSPSS